jgi:uncharacterized protein involved in outer membrane biogenesis
LTRRRTIFAVILVALICLCGAAMLVPVDSLRRPLESAASSALGRPVQINGHIHLAVYPVLGMALKDVSIANSPGAHDPQVITVGTIWADARLLPLLSGHVQVAKIVLKQPAIHLEVGKDGIGNWQAAVGTAQSPSAALNLGIEQIRVENGDLTYFDARTGKSETLSDVSLTLGIPGDASAGSLDGSATYHSVPLRIAAQLGDIAGFLQGKQSDASIKLTSDKFDASFTGQLKTPDTVTGALKLNAPSIRDLALWAGQAMPPGNGFGAVTVDAAISSTDGMYSLTKGKIALEGMALAGDFSVDTRHGGLSKADLTSISAYGGSGKGTLTLDPSGAVPTLRETLDMSGVRTEKILSQIMGIAKVSASGAVQLDLSARGRSENEIIASLSGRGTISGADLGAVARLLKSTTGLLSGAVGGGTRTEFGTLACSFTIENGVLRTNDLRMAGAGLDMTGAGTVNLASRQVEFHLVPKAQIGVAGVNVIDIGIPFYVNGTLDNPSFTPDPAGIAKAVVGGVVGTVKNTATGIVDVPLDAVKSLLGR